MKFKLIQLILGAYFSQSLAHAAFVQSSSLFEIDGTGSDTIILGSNSNFLLSGYAGSGTFSVSDAQVDTYIANNDFSALISSFLSGELIGESDFVDDADEVFGVVVPGAYAFSIGGYNEAPIIGTTLYTFMGNSADLSSSTHVALYRHNVVLAADPPSPTPETSYDLKLTGGSLLIGILANTNLDIPALAGETNYRTIQLESIAIPEPTTALLAAFGSLALLRRRRS